MSIPDLTDTTSWPDEDLTSLHSAVLREMTRRQTLAEAETKAADLADAYLDARDGTPPTESAETLADVAAWPAWVQPTGAHDAYPQGRIVQHNGTLYRSLIAANVWEPGGEGVPAGLWETATDAGDPPATPAAPEWVVGVAYQVGDLVTYQGKVYKCTIAHTSNSTWDPVNAVSLWTLN